MEDVRSLTDVGDTEIANMSSIATERWKAFGPHVEHHIGDIAWGMRDRSLPTHLVLIDDRAYALMHEDPYKFEARPGHEGLYADLIDAAQPDATFWALDTETAKIEALQSRGFAAVDDGHTWHLARDLDDLPEPPLPDGWTVKDATNRSEWARRVTVHRAAWEPSQFTEHVYETVRRGAAYRPELDVGVTTPDGEWASYCIAWLDEAAQTGELEPVGTALSYRRRGLGAAACLTALGRLRKAGATSCVVYASMDPANQGPRQLYESIGFRVVARHVSFRRPVLGT